MNPVATSDAAFRGGACPTPEYTIAYTGNYTTSADANSVSGADLLIFVGAAPSQAVFGVTRAQLMRHLREKGIGSQVHYIPVHRQPYYRRLYGDIRLPGADAYYTRCLSLPLYPDMTDDDPQRVANALASGLGLRQ